MKMRIIKPVENVEYTFRFPPKRILIYRWYGNVTDKGRLLLFNKTENYYTGMTPQYFTFLLRNRLVEKKTVDVAEKPPEPKTVATKQTIAIKEQANDTDKVTALDSDSLAFVDKAIKWLEDLRPEDKHYLQMKFSGQKELSITQMIANFKYIKDNGISNKGFGVMISRYLKLASTLSAFKQKLGGIK